MGMSAREEGARSAAQRNDIYILTLGQTQSSHQILDAWISGAEKERNMSLSETDFELGEGYRHGFFVLVILKANCSS